MYNNSQVGRVEHVKVTGGLAKVAPQQRHRKKITEEM